MTKAELGRRLDALPAGGALSDFGFLLPRLFGRNGQLDAQAVKAVRDFARQHNCVLSYPEFSREPVLFEKLSPEGWLPPYSLEGGRREPGLWGRDGLIAFCGDRRCIGLRRSKRRSRR